MANGKWQMAQVHAHRQFAQAAKILMVIHCLVLLAGTAVSLRAGDWPQWAGSDEKNMVSPETGLPGSFVPGDKRPEGTIDLATARNVRWGVRVGSAVYSTPSIAEGKVFVGAMEQGNGLMVCLEAATGRVLWKWKAPPKKFPHDIDGFQLGINEIPAQMGVCSSPAISGGRVYFVSHRFEVVCLDVNGLRREPGEARVVWVFDMEEKLGVFPCDAANGSPIIDGDLLYVRPPTALIAIRSASRRRRRTASSRPRMRPT